MSQKERDIAALAKTIYGEARGETREGQYAVAHSVVNRFHSNKSWLKGDTIEATCKKPQQYSCWNSNDINASKLQNAGAEFYQIAKEVIDGHHHDNTRGALHYHADYAKAAHQWADNKTPCATIGAHMFYNNID
ncbi:spore cortex-lytic enzyme-like [Clytia hemisphaerica]|uniref:Cell wall hydrolase SleB domain-containing protein n=1 Tax=Clytia hemisphaerica TaxID=252671 RepID=A0A7M6DJT9_9CNID|eukprot:TCONS_00001495-protein